MEQIMTIANNPLIPQSFNIGKVFTGMPNRQVMGYKDKTKYTPPLDEDYIFDESLIDILVWLSSENANDSLYVEGPTGCGKTSLLKQVFARLNIPVYEINANARMEFQDLVGMHSLRDGNTEFSHGPLSLAMRAGGVLLINEIDLLCEEAAASLNTILDGSALCIAENGGELIERSPFFKLIGTANTNGSGDHTGLYRGTARQNLAYIDRFRTIHVSYPDPKVELELLEKKYSHLSSRLRENLVTFANEIRKRFISSNSGDGSLGQLDITCSTRTVLQIAKMVDEYKIWGMDITSINPLRRALDCALINKASPQSKIKIQEIVKDVFKSNNWK